MIDQFIFKKQNQAVTKAAKVEKITSVRWSKESDNSKIKIKERF